MNDRRSCLRLARALTVGLLALTCLPALALGLDEKAELKQRFEQRYPTLVRLKNQARVGETPEGLAATVQDSHAGERVDPNDSASPTVAEFLKLENADRQRLYQILSEEQQETPEAVAKQNAIRNYKNAPPEHYLLVKDKQGGLVWTQKKNLK